jgi:hypothetical protein
MFINKLYKLHRLMLFNQILKKQEKEGKIAGIRLRK